MTFLYVIAFAAFVSWLLDENVGAVSFFLVRLPLILMLMAAVVYLLALL